MKSFKICIILVLFCVLLIPGCSPGKKQNLSTPLSRLVGHWQDPNEIHYYFGPVDYSSMTGSFVQVFPNKEKLTIFVAQQTKCMYQEDFEKGYIKTEEKLKNLLEGSSKYSQRPDIQAILEKYASGTVYYQYKVVSQAPEHKKIEIIILRSVDDPRPFFIPFLEAALDIEKNGKQMQIRQMERGRNTKYEIEDGMFDILMNPLKYIDSKTSPEH